MQDNPFRDTDVSSIYDNVDHPEVLSYCREQKQQLLDAITWYKKRKFSNPVINIFGETGSGKTFLLYSLTREFHEQKKGFFVEISPFNIVEEKNIDRLAAYIWQEIDAFFTKDISMINVQYQPVDLCIYKIYDKVIQVAEKRENAVCYKSGIFRKKRVPVYTTFAEFLKFFKNHKHRDEILESVFAQEKKNEVLLWLKNKFLQRKTTMDNNYKTISDLSSLCLLLKLPLIIVCDQFENLDKSNYDKPVGIYFTQLFELIRAIKRKNCDTIPLFINLLNFTSVDLLAHHINTRTPTLPHGQDRIVIDKTLDKEKALEVAKTYLQKINQHNCPFTLKEIAAHFDRYASSRVCDIRTWLIYCRHIWDVRFHGAKPFDRTSSHQQEVLNDEEIQNSANCGSDSKVAYDYDENINESTKKLVESSKLKEDIPIESLKDVCLCIPSEDFFHQIYTPLKSNKEALLFLIYVFISSLKKVLNLHSISRPQKNYFYCIRDGKKIYFFYSEKSNRGGGFQSSWEYFEEATSVNDGSFIKCIRCKKENVPDREEFALLLNKTISHCYAFDLEKGIDYDWLKYLYGTVYLLGNEHQLMEYNLPPLKISGFVWREVTSENVQENILEYLQENFLKGIL